ncbi:MAG: LamG domain-containing protein [Planctomycetes bacterium]|nr:LamG domain-containing protein [Planctomycetota bacterium]
MYPPRCTVLFLAAIVAAYLASPARADVKPIAHYHLTHEQGAVRDTAAPEELANHVEGGPALRRNGSPKVLSDAPEPRRKTCTGSIAFAEKDQCYRVEKGLVPDDNWVVEAWANARQATAKGGYHTVVACGDGGSGFVIGQIDGRWELLVGGVGGFKLGDVKAGVWTHLAVVKSRGAMSVWVDGVRVPGRPAVPGKGPANFSIGATTPGREAFDGWVSEVRLSTFTPGEFDPAADMLLDTAKAKKAHAATVAERVALVERLLAAPGAVAVTKFDEAPTTTDWLVKPPTTAASVQVLPGKGRENAQIMIANGLVSRTFLVTDNLGCVSFKRSDTGAEFVRAVKPEVRVKVDGKWLAVGGLTGAADHSFLSPEWYPEMESIPGALRFTGMTVGTPIKPYEWRAKCNAPEVPWPPRGKRVTFHFAPLASVAALKGLAVDVHYELFDGLPVVMKTFTVTNQTGRQIVVDEINAEYLAVAQDQKPRLHVESDYSFATGNLTSEGSALGVHVPGGPGGSWANYYLGGGTTKWEGDSDWGSMATLNPAEDLFLRNPQRALLVSRPPSGPAAVVADGGTFRAFRTFEILNDSDETERRFLAQRRFYRLVAPQVGEHQLEVHCPTHNTNSLKACIDQMAELGFERLQIEYPAGIAYDNVSPGHIKWLKDICDHGTVKGIRVGAYELMMASQGRGAANNCINPATGKQGSLFGQSGCGCSQWGAEYRDKMFRLIDATGLGSFNPDGPYHGDPCAATDHPGHRGLADSQWRQWEYMCGILHECQRRGLYVTIPDWYVLNGQVCTGMGYREASDNLDITLQTVLYRQYIFDGTFPKTPGMGWVNLNTEVLRGGLEANLERYETQFFNLIASGAQLWVRGGGLYDGPKSKEMVDRWVKWHRLHREVIAGDIIHLRRADGRQLDYYLHVNPGGKEKGMLLVFNPNDRAADQVLDVPLYYTGLDKSARVRVGNAEPKEYPLDRGHRIKLPVTVLARGFAWYVIE